MKKRNKNPCSACKTPCCAVFHGTNPFFFQDEHEVHTALSRKKIPFKRFNERLFDIDLQGKTCKAFIKRECVVHGQKPSFCAAFPYSIREGEGITLSCRCPEVTAFVRRNKAELVKKCVKFVDGTVVVEGSFEIDVSNLNRGILFRESYGKLREFAGKLLSNGMIDQKVFDGLIKKINANKATINLTDELCIELAEEFAKQL